MASHLGRRKFLATLGGAAVAWPLAARAQQRERMRRIGILWPSPPSANVERLQAFRLGLRDAGYVEGRDLVLEQRGAARADEAQELMHLVAQLIESKVDVIVTAGTSPTRAAKAAARNLPIVMTFVSDPVGSGFIDGLARPGGHITGLTNFGPELSAKWIELLKELVPGASRIGVLYTSPVRIVVQQMERAAVSAAVQLVPFEANSDDAIEQGLSILRNGQPTGLVVILPPRSQVKTIVDFTLTNRLPTIYWWREYVQAGGLAYYGAERAGDVSACGGLRRQDPQGGDSGRASGRAAHALRSSHQSQDRQGARPHRASDAARHRRRGDRMM
jgi:putative tryptophan/tyrosine transport system substrate-binding protein